MKTISNAEYMLLQIIAEKGELSGYEINRLVEERGYREWADIGTTSIYTGLARLQDKELVDSYVDSAKQGKGPLPRKFVLNEAGIEILKQEIFNALASSREMKHRFDLGLAAMPFLQPQEVIKALRQRRGLLMRIAGEVEKKFQDQGGEKLPLNVRVVFEHPLFLIKQETEYTDALIVAINREWGGGFEK